jgi:hypothetical protein
MAVDDIAMYRYTLLLIDRTLTVDAYRIYLSSCLAKVKKVFRLLLI